jgi:hypothetical protein
VILNTHLVQMWSSALPHHLVRMKLVPHRWNHHIPQSIWCHSAEYYNNDYASNSLLHITECSLHFQPKLLYLISFSTCPILSPILPFRFTRAVRRASPPILSVDKQVVDWVRISWKSVRWRVSMSVIHDCQPTYDHICNSESIIRDPTPRLWKMSLWAFYCGL